MTKQAPPRPEPVPRGALVAVGGGGTTAAIIERALALAGGKSARMLIVPQASSSAEAGEESRKFWQEHGATDVHVLDLADPAAANAEIQAAKFIWMPGGDQSRLCEALAKAGLCEAIVRRNAEGAVVGGTSAGAAALSKTMIIGGEKADLKSVKVGGTQVAEGIGVAANVIFDQHFVQRQRFTRMLACVLDHPEQVAVGVDEKTAVILRGTVLEVVGDSSALVLDARGTASAGKADGDLHSARGLKLHVLRPGDTLDIGR